MSQTQKLSNEELAKRDYVIMIDKSGSMETKDCPGGKSRWKHAEEYAHSIATKAAEFDADGIDVVVFAGQSKLYTGVTPDKVKQIFIENSPSGSTNTADALKLVFDEYKKKQAAGNGKPITVICVTDGAPTDEKAVDKVITDHANSLNDDSDTGITFIQIGKDAEARKFLEHLDNDLQGLGAKFDIVDTKNEDEMENLSIVEVLEAAVCD